MFLSAGPHFPPGDRAMLRGEMSVLMVLLPAEMALEGRRLFNKNCQLRNAPSRSNVGGLRHAVSQQFCTASSAFSGPENAARFEAKRPATTREPLIKNPSEPSVVTY